MVRSRRFDSGWVGADRSYKVIVAKDGSGDYASIQAAIDGVPDGNVNPYIIFIKNGIYREVVVIPPEKTMITLIGESRDGVVLTYDNGAGTPRPDGSGKTLGTSGSAIVLIQASDFTAERITFENGFDETSEYAANGAQAVAVKADADRLIFRDCRFLGNQDTLYASSGRQYYHQCYIEGDIDFIFAEATAVFEKCRIHSVDRIGLDPKGFITAPSTRATQPYGLIFIDCEITAEPSLGVGTVYLGRPWHPSKNGMFPHGDPGVSAQAVFIRCWLGSHIHPAGWCSMSTGGYAWPPENERFREYQNTGPGASAAHPLRKQLSPEEAEQFTVENILNGMDGWDPREVGCR
ncbi:MAG TPA: pectinesterase family protein [Bacillota bacterium]|nr:pectinesterase family protein [Bacillota bacterium]